METLPSPPSIEHPEPPFNQHIKRRFITGLFTLAPLAITFAVLRFLFSLLAEILSPVISTIFGDIPGILQNTISVILLLVLIYLAGLVTSNYIGRWIIGKSEKIVERVPIVRSIYTATKQVISTFNRPSGKGFERTIWVRFPTDQVYSIGFVTGQIQRKDGNELLKVLVPTAPNPTTGFLILVSPDDIMESDMPVDTAMRMLISGGILSPPGVNIA